jgi:hypothetical protein
MEKERVETKREKLERELNECRVVAEKVGLEWFYQPEIKQVQLRTEIQGKYIEYWVGTKRLIVQIPRGDRLFSEKGHSLDVALYIAERMIKTDSRSEILSIIREAIEKMPPVIPVKKPPPQKRKPEPSRPIVVLPKGRVRNPDGSRARQRCTCGCAVSQRWTVCEQCGSLLTFV